jgi:nucleotide-binding universal stress UspA family protein
VSSRPVVLVPVDRGTNVELVTQAARALAQPETPDIHVVNGTSARAIPAYARRIGARAIVMDRHYGTTPLWRNTAVVARMSRLSPVPVLALPSGGAALERWARGAISRVVAALDSTPASAVGLRAGVAFAARHEAHLTMLHAIEDFPRRPVFSGAEAWRIARELPARQRHIAARLEHEARLLGQADTAAHVITGDAASGIASAASETDADVIVMGVAARTWLDRLVSRSTLRGVLRRAHVPVLIVPVAAAAEDYSAVSRGRSSTMLPFQSGTPVSAAARAMACAPTAVVNSMNAAMLAARTTKANSGLRIATPTSRQPRPSVEALVDACIRVNTSGIRSMPMLANSASVAPAMRRTPDAHSIMSDSARCSASRRLFQRN